MTTIASSTLPHVLNRSELIDFLIQPNPSVKGAYFASLELVTVPPFLKKNRVTKEQTPALFSFIRNESKHNIQGNFIYSNAVNNRRQIEGVDDENSPRWESFPLPFGQRVFKDNKATPIIEHKGELYFQCRQMSVTDGRYFDLRTHKTINGELIFPDYLPIKQEGSGRQGVEKKIEVRTPKLSSIIAVTYAGTRYEIV